jgi:hypothetical protein
MALTAKQMRHVLRRLATGAATLLLATTVHAADCNVTSVGYTPVNDLGTGTYLNFQGGLYPGGVNQRPAAHESAGLARARSIGPMDANGNPDASGKYVLLSIGMSNTTQEFSEFLPIAGADPDKDPNLVIVDGAQSGQIASVIANPNSEFWSVVSNRLSGRGLTAEQVAVVWVKSANRADVGVDEYRTQLQTDLEEIARVLSGKFPNLQLAYYSSRIYAGYASTTLNPEPYAYESGFVVKSVIEKQLSGNAALNFDSSRGTVNAPWLAWGPYMWADGLNARSDGVTWDCSDFDDDGTHPSVAGRRKVANMLLDFFKSDATAREWFTDGATAPDTLPPSAPTGLRIEP